MTSERLSIVPVSFKEAAEYVEAVHRHHKAPVGHRFSIGVATDDGQLRGVAIVGRPVARAIDGRGDTLEVTRVATDGTRNACSALYGAAWRAAKALGYSRLITMTQQGESGASLRAAGWRVLGERPPRAGWESRVGRDLSTSGIARIAWERS